jgi:hypothetical protein
MLVNTLAINDLLNGTMATVEHGGEAFLEKLVYQWELIRMTSECEACDGDGFTVSYIEAPWVAIDRCEKCNNEEKIE